MTPNQKEKITGLLAILNDRRIKDRAKLAAARIAIDALLADLQAKSAPVNTPAFLRRQAD